MTVITKRFVGRFARNKKQAKELKRKSVKAVCVTDLSETFVAVMVASTAALKEAWAVGGAQGVGGTVDG